MSDGEDKDNSDDDVVFLEGVDENEKYKDDMDMDEMDMDDEDKDDEDKDDKQMADKDNDDIGNDADCDSDDDLMHPVRTLGSHPRNAKTNAVVRPLPKEHWPPMWAALKADFVDRPRLFRSCAAQSCSRRHSAHCARSQVCARCEGRHCRHERR